MPWMLQAQAPLCSCLRSAGPRALVRAVDLLVYLRMHDSVEVQSR